MGVLLTCTKGDGTTDTVTIPAGQVFNHPVSALDVAATAAELAKIESKPGDFDGVNLIPCLTGKQKEAPHEFLAWRWVA